MWPEYMSKPTLAKYFDQKPATIDQWLTRGLLPPPYKVGESLVWKKADVDSFITAGKVTEVEHDPYSAGARRVREATAAREAGQKQGGPALPVLAERPRN